MKFSGIIAALSLGSTAFGAVVSKRDTATILSDINTISSQLGVVYNDVQAFQGGPASALQALKIQSDSNTLSNSLAKAAKDVQSTAPLSSSDSATVALAVSALQPSIYDTLNALVAKEPGFENAALGFSAVSLVRQALVDLKTNTDNFGNNITAKVVPQLQKLAPFVVGEIDFHFARAISAYSG